MNLAIDVGNTKTKLGIFEEERLVKAKTFDSLKDLNQFLIDLTFESAVIASVNIPYDNILKELSQIQNPLLLSHETSLPFSNLYKSKTIGLDRIAAVAGAQSLYPSSNSLTIDLGTCITFEVLEKGQTYHGGTISPGLHMRFKAMHNFTARLPLVKPGSISDLIANNTNDAIKNGVVFGIQAEIEAYIQDVKKKYAPLTVIITGGDAKFFESKIKATIFAIPELVLVGLNAILRYNVPI